MSIMLTDEDRDYGSGLRQGFVLGTRLRWYAYPGNCPPDIPGQHDNRCLCWIETPDGMAYIGLRIFRGAENDYGWYSGHTRESGNVTHWMPLPEPPWVVGSHVLLRDDLPFMRATPTAEAAPTNPHQDLCDWANGLTDDSPFSAPAVVPKKADPSCCWCDGTGYAAREGSLIIPCPRGCTPETVDVAP